MGKHLTPSQRARAFAFRAKGLSHGEIAHNIKAHKGQVTRLLNKGKNCIAGGRPDRKKRDQKEPIPTAIVVPAFEWEKELDRAGPVVVEALQRALNAGDDKTAQGWLDKIAKVVQVKRGGALIDIRSTVNIQQTFINMAPDAQLQIIQSSPHWSALVQEMADVLAGCGTCEKAKGLLEKLKGE